MYVNDLIDACMQEESTIFFFFKLNKVCMYMNIEVYRIRWRMLLVWHFTILVRVFGIALSLCWQID